MIEPDTSKSECIAIGSFTKWSLNDDRYFYVVKLYEAGTTRQVVGAPGEALHSVVLRLTQ